MPVKPQDNEAIMARREWQRALSLSMAEDVNREWQQRLKVDYPLMAQQHLPKAPATFDGTLEGLRDAMLPSRQRSAPPRDSLSAVLREGD